MSRVLNEALDNVTDATSEFDSELSVAVVKALALFGLPILLGLFLVSRPPGGHCRARRRADQRRGLRLSADDQEKLGGRWFPYGLAYPFGTAAIIADAALRDDSNRLAMEDLVRTPPPVDVRHVVLVIDETVEGDAFSHLRSRHPPLPNAVDFGLAFQRGELLGRLELRAPPWSAGETAPIVDAPSLFAFARLAGMTTVYFDTNANTLRSFFQRTNSERSTRWCCPMTPRRNGPVTCDRSSSSSSACRRPNAASWS